MKPGQTITGEEDPKDLFYYSAYKNAKTKGDDFKTAWAGVWLVQRGQLTETQALEVIKLLKDKDVYSRLMKNGTYTESQIDRMINWKKKNGSSINSVKKSTSPRKATKKTTRRVRKSTSPRKATKKTTRRVRKSTSPRKASKKTTRRVRKSTSPRKTAKKTTRRVRKSTSPRQAAK